MITRQCDVETVQDFARYYASSYVGWHGRLKEAVSPAYISNLSGDRVLMRFLSKDDSRINMSEAEEVTFKDIKEHVDFGRPTLGLTKDGPTIIFLSQSTPREGRKGLRVRESKIHEFNSFEIQSYYLRPATYSDRLDWVWSGFNPIYTPFQEALKQLESGSTLGVPLTKDLGLYTLPKSPYPLVSYKRWTVGYVRSSALIYLYSFYADYEQYIRNRTEVEVQIV